MALALVGNGEPAQASETARLRLILVGDSTVKNGQGRGDGGLWGWGQVIDKLFDTSRLDIENHAIGGRSSRTFLTEGRWDRVMERLRPGDYVIIQFGHNDGGERFQGNRPRASLKGNGDDTERGVVEITGQAEVVRSYGWYLRKYIADAKAKGAIPVVCSPVPRNRWHEGKVLRADKDYGKWAADAARQAGALYIDLNDIVAQRYEQLGEQDVSAAMFTEQDWTHTTRAGAELTAQCLAEALGHLPNSKLKDYLLTGSADHRPVRQMERLSRAPVAVHTDDGVFLSWRLLPTDPEGTAFEVYRQIDDGELVLLETVAGPTNFLDSTVPQDSEVWYKIRPEGAATEAGSAFKPWQQNYLEIPIVPIEGYRPGDASIGDLDGDGELEIVLHQTKDGRDNSHNGITGTPILDAYKLDGTHLWRIDLGKNIREGEHYTQFMVYDLDGDGRAEIACKTADGTVDGVGQVIGDPTKDYRDTDEHSRSYGRILEGPEFFTIFDGQTGEALVTVDYIPSREPIDGWGGIGGNAGNDSRGNRCDRFLACVAYLDGERPSVVMCRGVYGRIVMAAWDWREGELTSRWVFDSGISYPPFDDASPYSGMGGHSLSVADVDDDGRDEIVYQAMVVDDNGEGLYSTGLRHGDSMHISDMYPDRPGLEVFTIQENEENADKFNTPGVAMRDARTGEILWSHSPGIDVGAGMAADIDPTHYGYEAWGGPGGIRNSKGEEIGPAPRETSWCVWWDGDLLRELFSAPRPRWQRGARSPRDSDGAATSRRPGDGLVWPAECNIGKWNWQTKQTDVIATLPGRPVGRGPSLVGDLLGDWREELLLVAPDGKSLRLFTTTIPTEHRLVTLLADPQYRLGMVWQNVVYNKPAHPSFYLGEPRP